MADIEQIKALRDRTGVSVGECKKALEEADGDIDKAIEVLKSKGAAVAAKKSGRALGAGVVSAYIHNNGQVGTLLTMACETDFVAKNPEFKTMADDIAMQIAAFVPANVEELLALPFIKDPSLTVADVIKNGVQKFGERIELVAFNRLAVGE